MRKREKERGQEKKDWQRIREERMQKLYNRGNNFSSWLTDKKVFEYNIQFKSPAMIVANPSSFAWLINHQNKFCEFIFMAVYVDVSV